jgi:hypothetical protein
LIAATAPTRRPMPGRGFRGDPTGVAQTMNPSTTSATRSWSPVTARPEIASGRRVSGVHTAQVVDTDVDGPVVWMATTYVRGHRWPRWWMNTCRCRRQHYWRWREPGQEPGRNSRRRRVVHRDL